MSYYFSHDSNARNNEKLIALRMKHGWEGYGLYWAIIEKLREASSNRLSTDYTLIAYDLRTEVQTVESIVCHFNLFAFEREYFYSPGLRLRMELSDVKSSRARQSAQARRETAGLSQQPVRRQPQSGGNIPPTPEEVQQYCEERNNGIAPQKFIDYYESKGWMVGRNKMKNWRSAVRIWERSKPDKLTINESENTGNEPRLHPALQ